MSSTRGPRGIVERLLVAWQSTGDEKAFEELFGTIVPLAERVARRMLRSAGIADPAAIDDATSRVFDHLRRLPGPTGGERSVVRFRVPFAADDASDGGSEGEPDGGPVHLGCDSGIAFVCWLARKRAHDIVRSRRRHARHARVFSQLDAIDAGAVRRMTAADGDAVKPHAEEIRHALAELDERSRSVVERILAGESQTSIARQMGVCEGTVSRIRTRAIERMRGTLDRTAVDGTVLGNGNGDAEGPKAPRTRPSPR